MSSNIVVLFLLFVTVAANINFEQIKQLANFCKQECQEQLEKGDFGVYSACIKNCTSNSLLQFVKIPAPDYSRPDPDLA
ncbi:unnamed protein product [Cylicocyclus nassatus]|uniref:Uncharacterized protein n=1 Tax=Cylicocyclus nassatus TaxID=53992 RepID=A0AA36DL09_CYLNA|nr:unnamed protein product [Cylicocyclus nassatus]CAJ0589070.1 unnamed protein product [Cylicocyclus nassatus]CAJ0589071.1 unnamed protein product [Cylicocyclus nassatus]